MFSQFETFLPSPRGGVDSETPLNVFGRMRDEAGSSPWELFQGTMGEGGFPVDVSETAGEVLVTAEMPGFAPGDIQVKLRDGALLIRGEKRPARRERGESLVRMERSYGFFVRAIPLQAGVSGDGLRVEYAGGVLSVRLPKAAPRQPGGMRFDA
jgi:HSP20 family molecular chaperone IbpA